MSWSAYLLIADYWKGTQGKIDLENNNDGLRTRAIISYLGVLI